MTVYIVEHAKGSYELYQTFIEKVFLNREFAEKYVEEFDSKRFDFEPPMLDSEWDPIMYEYNYRHEDDVYSDIYRFDYNNEEYIKELYDILKEKNELTEYTLEDVKDMVYYEAEVRYEYWHKSQIHEYEVTEG